MQACHTRKAVEETVFKAKDVGWPDDGGVREGFPHHLLANTL